LAEDEVVVVPPGDELLLAARKEPVLRPALAVLVDEGEDVLVLGVVVQVVVLGDRLRVAAGLRMRRDVLDQLALAEHAPAVANGLEVVGTGTDHSPSSFAGVGPRGSILAVNRGETVSPDHWYETSDGVNVEDGGCGGIHVSLGPDCGDRGEVP